MQHQLGKLVDVINKISCYTNVPGSQSSFKITIMSRLWKGIITDILGGGSITETSGVGHPAEVDP